jgi:hypothetical protein
MVVCWGSGVFLGEKECRFPMAIVILPEPSQLTFLPMQIKKEKGERLVFMVSWAFSLN